VANALVSANVMGFILMNEKVAIVVVPDLSLSFGDGERRTKRSTSAKLTGWKIDIKRNPKLVP
jgi:transcription antitermination factor NusA-like protein